MQEEWTTGIHTYRSEIDGIDQQMIDYLAKRFEAAKHIAELKKQCEQPVVQADRAKEVERRYVKRGTEHQLSASFMSRLYQLIHEETCRIEAEIIKDEVREGHSRTVAP